MIASALADPTPGSLSSSSLLAELMSTRPPWVAVAERSWVVEGVRCGAVAAGGAVRPDGLVCEVCANAGAASRTHNAEAASHLFIARSSVWERPLRTKVRTSPCLAHSV